MGTADGFKSPVWQNGREQGRKQGKTGLQRVMGPISEGFTGSMKGFDLYSKSSGKLCMLLK